MPISPSKITPQQADEWLKKGDAVIIDVREPSEFNEEHITGAICHPVSSLNAAHIHGIAGGKKIVFQCASGKRAGTACEQYAAAAGGNDNVFLMEGSLPGWKQAGLPTQKGAGVIPLERQVLIAAGSIVLAGVLLSVFAAPAFVWLSGFAGAGMIYAGISGNCMMKKLLMQMPYNR